MISMILIWFNIISKSQSPANHVYRYICIVVSLWKNNISGNFRIDLNKNTSNHFDYLNVNVSIYQTGASSSLLSISDGAYALWILLFFTSSSMLFIFFNISNIYDLFILLKN